MFCYLVSQRASHSPHIHGINQTFNSNVSRSNGFLPCVEPMLQIWHGDEPRTNSLVSWQSAPLLWDHCLVYCYSLLLSEMASSLLKIPCHHGDTHLLANHVTSWCPYAAWSLNKVKQQQWKWYKRQTTKVGFILQDLELRQLANRASISDNYYFSLVRCVLEMMRRISTYTCLKSAVTSMVLYAHCALLYCLNGDP